MALPEPSSPGERGKEKRHDDDKEKAGAIAENELSVAASDEAGDDIGTEGGYRAWATVLGG